MERLKAEATLLADGRNRSAQYVKARTCRVLGYYWVVMFIATHFLWYPKAYAIGKYLLRGKKPLKKNIKLTQR